MDSSTEHAWLPACVTFLMFMKLLTCGRLSRVPRRTRSMHTRSSRCVSGPGTRSPRTTRGATWWLATRPARCRCGACCPSAALPATAARLRSSQSMVLWAQSVVSPAPTRRSSQGAVSAAYPFCADATGVVARVLVADEHAGAFSAHVRAAGLTLTLTLPWCRPAGAGRAGPGARAAARGLCYTNSYPFQASLVQTSRCRTCGCWSARCCRARWRAGALRRRCTCRRCGRRA